MTRFHGSAPSTDLTRRSSAPDAVSCVVEEFDQCQFPPRDGWLQLFERASNSHVWHHPDYVRAAFPALGIPGWTVTCRRGSRPVSMAILIPKRCQFGRTLLPGAGSSLVGVRLSGFGFLGEDDPAIMDRLVDELAGEVLRRKIRVVEFENLEEHSDLWRSLQRLRSRGFRFAPTDAFDLHHRIRLPDSADAYWNSFHSRHRYKLRKERKRIGEYTVRRYTQASDVDDWLTVAHEISQKSWQSHQLGLRIRNNDEERAYLTFLATLGALRSYVLFMKDHPAAFVLSHQWNGVYHYDELGFDRSLSKHNPGKVLLQEILTDLMTENRPQIFDFGLGDADYKQFFANEQSRSATLWMFPPGMRSRWQAASIQGGRRAGRVARGLLEKLGWAAALRQKLRDRAGGKSDPGECAVDP